MFQRMLRQLCLHDCGFFSASAAEACSSDALQADAPIHPAWGVLLQHSAMHTTGTVCRLLCTSRGVRASVLLLCKGTIAAAPGATSNGLPDRVDCFYSFAKFLPQYAALLQHLDLRKLYCFSESDQRAFSAVSAELSRSLWEARDSLCLQSLQIHFFCPEVHEPVAASSSCRRHLTRLVVRDDEHSLPFNPRDALQRLSNTVKQLTELRSLTVFEDGVDGLNANPLLPALSGLTKLTHLDADISRLGDPGRYLPASLLELHMGADRDADWDPKVQDEPHSYYDLGHPPREEGTLRPLVLDLTRLTAITKLDLRDAAVSGRRRVAETVHIGDKLPPNTQWLCLGHEYGRKIAFSVVAGLSCLTYLDLTIDELEAEDIRVLTKLTNLQEVRLEAFQSYHYLSPHNTCRTWPLLPVKSFDLYSGFGDETYVSTRMLQQMAKLTGLTHLWIEISDESKGSVKDLGFALQQLQQLRGLHLHGCRNLQPLAPPTDKPGPAQLNDGAAAVCGMRQLTSLHLEGLDFTRANMKQLAKLRQLERLALRDCSITNFGAGVIAANIKGLTLLDLSCNLGVSKVALPTVRQRLPLLKELLLQHTGRDWYHWCGVARLWEARAACAAQAAGV